jgi:hypothetical protein
MSKSLSAKPKNRLYHDLPSYNGITKYDFSENIRLKQERAARTNEIIRDITEQIRGRMLKQKRQEMIAKGLADILMLGPVILNTSSGDKIIDDISETLDIDSMDLNREEIDDLTNIIIKNRLKTRPSVFRDTADEKEVEILVQQGFPRELAELISTYSQGIRLPPRVNNLRIVIKRGKFNYVITVGYSIYHDLPICNFTKLLADDLNVFYDIILSMGFPMPPIVTVLELSLIWESIEKMYTCELLSAPIKKS